MNRLFGCIEAEAETASLNPRCDYTIPDRAKDMTRAEDCARMTIRVGLQGSGKEAGRNMCLGGRDNSVFAWKHCWRGTEFCHTFLDSASGMRLRGKYSDQTKLYGYRHQNLIGRKLQLADNFVSFGRRR